MHHSLYLQSSILHRLLRLNRYNIRHNSIVFCSTFTEDFGVILHMLRVADIYARRPRTGESKSVISVVFAQTLLKCCFRSWRTMWKSFTAYSLTPLQDRVGIGPGIYTSGRPDSCNPIPRRIYNIYRMSDFDPTFGRERKKKWFLQRFLYEISGNRDIFSCVLVLQRQFGGRCSQ